jgi:hypothetical protein
MFNICDTNLYFSDDSTLNCALLPMGKKVKDIFQKFGHSWLRPQALFYLFVLSNEVHGATTVSTAPLSIILFHQCDIS